MKRTNKEIADDCFKEYDAMEDCGLNLEKNIRRLKLSAIIFNRGNMTKAAKDLGISERSLYNDFS